MIIDALEVVNGDVDQLARLVGTFDQVYAELLWVAPGGGAVHAGVQVGVADQRLAAQPLDGAARDLVELGEVLVAHIELQAGHVVPGAHEGHRPRGDFAVFERRAVERRVDFRPQVRPEDGERLAVEALSFDGLEERLDLKLGVEPAVFEVGRRVSLVGLLDERIVGHEADRRAVNHCPLKPGVDSLQSRFKVSHSFQFNRPPALLYRRHYTSLSVMMRP